MTGATTASRNCRASSVGRNRSMASSKPSKADPDLSAPENEPQEMCPPAIRTPNDRTDLAQQPLGLGELLSRIPYMPPQSSAVGGSASWATAASTSRTHASGSAASSGLPYAGTTTYREASPNSADACAWCGL